MAIAVHSTAAWTTDSDFDNNVTSGTFSPPAGSVVLVVVHHYLSGTAITPTTSGSLTFAAGPGRVHSGNSRMETWTATSVSAQSNITVTITSASYPSVAVYVLTGADTSVPIGANTGGGGQTSTPLTVPTSTVDSTVANSLQFVAAWDANAAAAPTSSDLTYIQTPTTLVFGLSGYKSLGAVGTDLAAAIASSGSPSWQWVTFEVKPEATATTHNADAALSTTSTVSPTIAATRAGAAALSTASAITATAALTAAAAAAVSTTATLTATMDVTPASGTVTFDAALSTTSALTATAVLERPAAAALSTAVAIAATMVIEGETPTTVGFMRAAEMAAATIRPRGGVTLPTIAALVSIDEATMTAVVSTSIPGSRYGVPLLVGGSVDPVTAGLVPSGSAYVWFADDGIHVQGAS